MEVAYYLLPPHSVRFKALVLILLNPIDSLVTIIHYDQGVAGRV